MKKFIKKLAGVVAVVVCSTCINACSCGEGKYIITLYSGYEGGDSTFEWVANKPFTKPEDPKRKGYIFDGWFADKELTIPYDFNASVKGNLTIFAKWIKCGYITLPETSMLQHGYKVSIPEGEDDLLLIGEKVEFTLKISSDYIKDSNPVLKINGEAIDFKEFGADGSYTKYVYEYTCVGEDINVKVEGIVKNNFDVVWEDVEGVTIRSLNGYSNLDIPKNNDYKFIVLAEDGYDISDIVITANGETLTLSGGVYVIPNISENIEIEISQVKKQTYDVTFLENYDELNTLIGKNIKIIRQVEKATFAEEYTFSVSIISSKYSQALPTLANNLQVFVGEEQIDSQYITVNNGLVIISGEVITGELNINIDSNNFPVNILTLTLPENTKEEAGYAFKILGCDENGGDNFKPVNDSERQFAYGSKLKIGLDIKEEYLEYARLAGVSILNINTDASNEVSIHTYIAKNGSNEQYLIINLNRNTTLQVKAEFNVGFDNVDGVRYVKEAGYEENKAYCFGDLEGVLPRTFKFKVDINKDAYDTTSMIVGYYVNDINNMVELTAVDGVYTISNISSDIRVITKNVIKKTFGFELPEALNGVESLTIIGQNSNLDSLSFFDKLQIEVKVAKSHNKYMDNIMLTLSDKATVTKLSRSGDVITFELSEFKEDITALDFDITGEVINSYIVTLPRIENRVNYILKNSKGEEIVNNFIFVDYGDSVQIEVVPNSEYSNDNNFEYTIKIKEEEFSYDSNNSFIITIADIYENIELLITGIETKNNYVVNFYDYDGETLLDSKQVVHGESVSTEGIEGLSTPKYYEFDSWNFADINDGIYEANGTIFDGQEVLDNINVVAVKKATEYIVKFDNVYTDDNKIIISIEDFVDGYYDLSGVGFIREKYTFDKFILGENIETGTALTKISEDMLVKRVVGDSVSEDDVFDILLRATWKITVGYVDCNCSTLSEAILDASTTEVDTIEIVGSIRNESTIHINKSVRIIGVGDTKRTITSSLSGLDNYGYESLIFIEGSLGKKINVYIENISFSYSNSSIRDMNAATIVANNCDLTLNKINISSQANGIVFIGKENNNLVIDNGEITILNHEITGRNYDFGIKLITEETNIVANISNTNFKVNYKSESYKAVHYEAQTGIANICLDNCIFTGEEVVELPTAVAVKLDGNAELETINCVINEFVNYWATFIENGFSENVVSSDTSSEKYLHLKNNLQYIKDLIDVAKYNNTIKNCQIYIKTYNDQSDTLLHRICVNELGIIIEFVEFNNVAQLVKYLPYESSMNYLKSDSLIINSSIVVAEDQIVDFNNSSIEFNNTLNNSGAVLNCKDLEANNGFINAGSITATGNVYLGANSQNDGSIFAHTILLDEGFEFVNNGSIDSAYLNNLGNFVINSGDVSINRTLVDEENIEHTFGLLTNDGTITINIDGIMNVLDGVVNNGVIHIYGEFDTGRSLINNTSSQINVYSNAKLTLLSENLMNLGSYNKNDGAVVVDNSVGNIKIGTINDYGILGECSLEEYVSYLYIEGSAEKVSDDSIVAKLYPNGTGYYLGFTIYTGIENANKNIDIKISRIDGIEYLYKEKTATDMTDELGRLEIILDLNVVDGVRRLFDVFIEIDSLDGNVNLDYDIANGITIV